MTADRTFRRVLSMIRESASMHMPLGTQETDWTRRSGPRCRPAHLPACNRRAERDRQDPESMARRPIWSRKRIGETRPAGQKQTRAAGNTKKGAPKSAPNLETYLSLQLTKKRLAALRCADAPTSAPAAPHRAIVPRRAACRLRPRFRAPREGRAESAPLRLRRGPARAAPRERSSYPV